MARLICTIWALLLNVLGLPIFQTCFANVMEDEDGEPLLTGPPITCFLFNLGVYTIIASSTLFPPSFRDPKEIFLVMYEFLATAFFLEFSTACIWTPMDLLILTTLPKNICHYLHKFGFGDMAETVLANKSVLTIVTQTLATTFFLVSLHVTDAVDFTILRDDGAMSFASTLRYDLSKRIQKEIPNFLEKDTTSCRCKTRRKGRSKNGAN